MADRILRKEAIGMFKIYPDDQVVRGVRRAYPEGGDGYTAIDIGCVAGRHTKLLLELGFKVKAIDIDEKNIQDTRNTLKGFENTKKLSCECRDFGEISEKGAYDLVIAWNFLYAYNRSINDCLERIKKIHELLKTNGKVLLSLKSTEDVFNKMFKKDKDGLINNTIYNTPGNIFLSQKETVQLMNEAGFDIDYLEKFSRSHTLDWREIGQNKEWENANLNLFEDWYAVCATKR